MNYGFETPDGWKAIDEWLDGAFFEKLESEGAVLLLPTIGNEFQRRSSHFTQLGISLFSPRTAGARSENAEQIAEHAKALD